jgi:hypothetical protein
MLGPPSDPDGPFCSVGSKGTCGKAGAPHQWFMATATDAHTDPQRVHFASTSTGRTWPLLAACGNSGGGFERRPYGFDSLSRQFSLLDKGFPALCGPDMHGDGRTISEFDMLITLFNPGANASGMFALADRVFLSPAGITPW